METLHENSSSRPIDGVALEQTNCPDYNQAIRMIEERLQIIEGTLKNVQTLLEGRSKTREWYGVNEAAEVLGKATWTVREWCRTGRVNAHKRPCGRGRSQEWILSHAEIERIRNKGLLPTDL